MGTLLPTTIVDLVSGRRGGGGGRSGDSGDGRGSRGSRGNSGGAGRSGAKVGNEGARGAARERMRYEAHMPALSLQGEGGGVHAPLWHRQSSPRSRAMFYEINYTCADCSSRNASVKNIMLPPPLT